ncbi:MAG: hypothetical protein M5U28_34825 [Sandaracinaceae bacterium]|nr:hypothetical protein [Sandaracinaceae bacterium]
MLFRELAPRLASADVRFGELLAKFFAVRGWRVLGFATERQYAEERLGMSRSSVRARISLSRRVTHLSRLGEALREGAVGYEAAALVARVATPDTEEAWIERAKRRTHKHLAEEIHAVEMIAQMMRLEDPPGPPDDEEVAIAQAIERDFVSGAYARRAFAIEREDDEAPRVGEGSSSPFAEMARAAHAVQEQLRAVIGAARARSGAVSDGDALAACVGVAEPAGALPVRDLEDDVVWMKGAPSAGAAAAAREAEAPGHLPRADEVGAAHGEAAAVQTSVSALTELLSPSPSREREGERSRGRGTVAVQTSVGVLAASGEAAVQTSVGALAELLSPSPLPRAGGGGPAVRGEAGAVDTGAVQMSVSALGLVADAVCEPGDEEKLAERIREALAPRWPSVRLRVRAPEWMILQYRQLEAAHGRSGCGGSFVHFLVMGFWAVWAPVLGRSNECEPITRRDRYVCTCPVCGRPAGPGHHIVFRAHGGGDEMENQTSPCPWCHLEGVHLGRLRVTGQAPGDLVWVIGRTPIMEVRGREKRLAA